MGVRGGLLENAKLELKPERISQALKSWLKNTPAMGTQESEDTHRNGVSRKHIER